MKKSARARQFNEKARKEIYARDEGCIFCRMGYHMEKADSFSTGIIETMHIVPKSQGGLGIAQNGVLGCKYHHVMFDNGSDGHRSEMKERISSYMSELYPGWDEKDLIFKKGEIR